jgi:hypothetical protein
MSHLFQCSTKAATNHRSEAFKTLSTSIRSLTPDSTINNALLDSLESWLQLQTITPEPTWLYLALQAIEEQSILGWLHALQGHLSRRWRLAVLSALPTTLKTRNDVATNWAKKVISSLWTFSFSVWDFRNAMVHGRTSQKSEGKGLKQLKTQIRDFYKSFSIDPHLVPQSRSYLFDRPIQITLQLQQQQLQSWVESVREAIATRESRHEVHLKKQQDIMRRFFRASPFHQMRTRQHNQAQHPGLRRGGAPKLVRSSPPP